jgi:autotransporter family porin
MDTIRNNHKNVILIVFISVILIVALYQSTMAVQASGFFERFAANTPIEIYTDQLGEAWQNWPWGANIGLENTSPVQSGSDSISVKINDGWGALYLHREPAQTTSGYTNLEFYVHGGATGGQALSVVANGNTGATVLFTATKNSWVKISIPLSDLGSPASITDLYIQNATDAAQAVFYVDNIMLVDSSLVLSANGRKSFLPLVQKVVAQTPTRTRTPTRTPTVVRTPGESTPSASYFSMLPPGSALPSDAACAAAVRAKPENKRDNKTYNATKGNQGIGTNFFPGSNPLANTYIAPRVNGNFTGTTDEIIQWAACKWGFDEDVVRAQAAIESWWNQDTKGDWTSDSSRCAPGHGLGVDGKSGQCPESFGIVQNRYPYEQAAWPGIDKSTAFNLDVGYAEMRACYEGYETWLNDVEQGSHYAAGDMWGCIGRWYAGRWHTSAAEGYITRVKDYLNQRIWEKPEFQEP